MPKSTFDTEQEANDYKREHQLLQRVAVPLFGRGKWALIFPIEAHITVNDGAPDGMREPSGNLSNYREQPSKAEEPALANHKLQGNATPAGFKVLLTLHTSCGCVGQGVLGAGNHLTWTAEPDGETVQAVFSRYSAETMTIVEVAQMNGDEWREFEDSHAEAALVANVANGHSLAVAIEQVPEPESAIHCESPGPGM